MARLIERKFDPARPTYARKYFTAAGRKFVPNDLFDWQKLAVSQRRAMQMFDAGKLTHKDKEPTPKDKALQDFVEAERYWDADDKSVEDQDILAAASDDKPDPGDHWHYIEPDELDAIDDLKELRRIADEIGAPYKVSKADQREAIRAHRKEMSE